MYTHPFAMHVRSRILLLINDTYAVTVAGVQYVNGIFIALQEHVIHICGIDKRNCESNFGKLYGVHVLLDENISEHRSES